MRRSAEEETSLGQLRRLSFKTKPQHTRWDDLLAMWLEVETIEELETGWLFDHFYPRQAVGAVVAKVGLTT